jgi:choline kinase
MKAIILAAGEGKRLRPLTNDVPKCMIKLFDKTILEHQISVFHKCDINDLVVVTGYKSESISLPNLRYYKNVNYDTTNMVETLFCAAKELDDSVIISYGDIIFEKQVLEKLIESKDNCSIIVDRDWKRYWDARFSEPLEDAESLEMNSDGFITNIGQKVSTIDKIQGQYIGLMKFQNNGVNILKQFYKDARDKSIKGNVLNPKIRFEQSYMTDMLQGMIKEKIKLRGILISNGWLELDSIEDYQTYYKMYQNNTLTKFINVNQL